VVLVVGDAEDARGREDVKAVGTRLDEPQHAVVPVLDDRHMRPPSA
jgi:hypothetical protein